MTPYEIIAKKRDKKKLTRQELEFIVKNYTEGTLPDYQMSAFLMAAYINSLSEEETIWLTEIMLKSGKNLNLKDIDLPKVDKHSTGGVGDGVSIILAPLLATFDLVVPMMSGRSLGHTGGTLDKLESIEGFNVNLSEEQLKKQLKKIKVAIFTATKDIVPADKKIYALRDVTATVESIPLIAASIMSKKLAEDIDALLLDVKIGNGAFIQKNEDAKKLAMLMVKIAKTSNLKISAMLTNMDQPLGEYIGNSLEIYQAIKILKNEGPKDITQLVIEQAAKILQLSSLERNIEKAKVLVKKNLESGLAFEKFRQLVKLQGGNILFISKPKNLLKAKYCEPILSNSSGYIKEINTKLIGNCATLLGAGRQKINDRIDHFVGFRILKKINDYVDRNEPLIYVYYNDKKKFDSIKNLILNIFLIKPEIRKGNLPLIYDIIE
ncbi:MAG: thymidine phosphorylase [Endomicrobia bacterium]|nr:thymidine phosphorylase [Endomicrobiia bacterium]